ncbi:conserved hypothetical protein [Beggiatoa sp. PS]|nr:conserved hypothetical protein [Beggiatoa sp. PS]
MGRITQKAETVDGVTTTYDYHYDIAGRLDEVQQNEVIVEAYGYDDNGNRQTAETASGSVIANYDDPLEEKVKSRKRPPETSYGGKGKGKGKRKNARERNYPRIPPKKCSK